MSEPKNQYHIDRIRWQCRRGMLELDEILDSYVCLEFENLPESQKECFLELLGQNDTQLFEWFNNPQLAKKAEFKALIEDILVCVKKSNV